MTDRLINTHLSLGLDIGTASIGWAVFKDGKIDFTEHEAGRPQFGAFCWSIDEDGKRVKGEKKRLRRTISRRRKRMGRIRRLFEKYKLTKSSEADSLSKLHFQIKDKGISPIELRARGLDKLLTKEEFAIALANIAKHRGFLSNSKKLGLVKASVEETLPTDKGDDKETQKMKKGLSILLTDLANSSYRTLGELIARDPRYIDKGRIRNRGGVYDLTGDRLKLKEEVALLFEAQRNKGNEFATKEFEKEFIDIAFFQRPLKDSERLLGNCPFEPSKKRSSMKSPSFEIRRLYEKLNQLKLMDVDDNGADIKDSVRYVVQAYPTILDDVWAILGTKQGITFKQLRKLLGLGANTVFYKSVTIDKEGERDIALSTNKTKGCIEANYIFAKVLGEELYRELISTEEGLRQLDDAADILTFREDLGRIRKGLRELNLKPSLLNKLYAGLDNASFKSFSGASRISSLAARKLLVHLRSGALYSDACAKAGYNHTDMKDLFQIRTDKDFGKLIKKISSQEVAGNGVVKKALIEALKQTWCLIKNYGLPKEINVEVARELSKGIIERKKLEKGLKDATEAKNKARSAAVSVFGRMPSDSEFERYCLWKEFDGKCIYSGKSINPNWLQDGANVLEVDHILPWSKTYNDSFKNKALILASENQGKKELTAFEWISQKSPQEIKNYRDRVELSKCSNMKKANLLKVLSEEEAEARRGRSSNDNAAVAKAFLEFANYFYPVEDNPLRKGGKKHVFARPGALTSALRKAYGIEHLKYQKNKDGKRERVGDTNHMIDAVVVGCVSEKELIKFSKMLQSSRLKGRSERLGELVPPWKGFKQDLEKAVNEMTVTRLPQSKSKGAIHAETLRSLVTDPKTNKTAVYSKINLVKARGNKTPAQYVDYLKKEIIPKLKDGAYTNPKTGIEYDKAALMRDALTKWVSKGCPKETLPYVNGLEVHCVQVKQGSDSGVKFKSNQLPDAGVTIADNAKGSLVRIDVFSSTNKKGVKKLCFIPITRSEINSDKAPNGICKAQTSKTLWPKLTDEVFEFTLYPRSLISYAKNKEDKEELGYVAGVHINKGAINCYPTETSDSKKVLTLSIAKFFSFKKCSIDRLGRVTIEKQNTEERLWHGKPCISQQRQD